MQVINLTVYNRLKRFNIQNIFIIYQQFYNWIIFFICAGAGAGAGAGGDSLKINLSENVQ